MAITRSNSALDVVIETGRTFFHQKMQQIREAQVKRRVYRATFIELSSLSERGLNDLGIPRSSIKRLALETAYGI